MPRQRYLYTETKRAKVGPDYHIEYRRHYYSVPHQLVGHYVELEASSRLVQIYHQGNLVTQHQRSQRERASSTNAEHMPTNHQHQTWSPGRLDGSYQKQRRVLSRKASLVLDDWGMETLTQEHVGHRLEVLEDRYQASSTIVISQLPVKEWYNMIGNATVADALLDRLVHNSHGIELGGESMRKLAQSDHLA